MLVNKMRTTVRATITSSPSTRPTTATATAPSTAPTRPTTSLRAARAPILDQVIPKAEIPKIIIHPQAASTWPLPPPQPQCNITNSKATNITSCRSHKLEQQKICKDKKKYLTENEEIHKRYANLDDSSCHINNP